MSTGSPGRHAARSSPPIRNLLLVAAGGALGTLARVALGRLVADVPRGFPWTTFAANVGGAFALALILTSLAERFRAGPHIRLLVGTGVLGAFTTYSTFATEIAERLLAGHLLLATGYAVATIVAGLAAAAAGVRVARSRTTTRVVASRRDDR